MSKRNVIIAIVLLVAVIAGGKSLYSTSTKDPAQSPVMKQHFTDQETERILTENKVIIRDGKEFIIEEMGPISITIVNDWNCSACDTRELIKWLKGQFGTTLAFRSVEFDSEEGKNIIKEHDATYLPFILVGKEVAKQENLDHLTHHIITATQDSYFVDLEKLGARIGKYLWATYYSRTDPDAPRLIAMSTEYDFGDVSLKKGIVKTAFLIKNTGKNPLEFFNITTSCGCTTAQVELTSGTSPTYTMPGHKEPEIWRGKLAPGENAKLIVYYDPSVHKDLVGAVTREIYVTTNDPVTPEMKIRIKVNQTI
jgi:hypothetical protein